MLEHHISSFAINVQYLLVGLALAVALQRVLTWHQRRAGRVAFWSAVSSASLAAALGANLWALTATKNQFDLAMSVRDAALVIAVLVQIPTVAAFAAKPWPRPGIVTLSLLSVARWVLWLSTDLVYAHRGAVNGAPLYGPLWSALNGLQLLICAGLVARLALGWPDRSERRVFLAGFGLGLAVVMASFLAGETPLAELLAGYWVVPWVVALQVLFARRVLALEAASGAHARERAASLAALARAERRVRLALRSGAMGWFEYDPATRQLEASSELRAILGLGPHRSGLTIDAALGFFHHEDRPRLREGLAHAEADGPGAAEARWERPDGVTVWVEMSALQTELGGGGREVVGVMKDITDRKAAEAELVRQARSDALTGLSNRAGLTDQAGQALRREKPFCLLLVGLDGFRDINDTLGHPVGDQVLAGVAWRLASGLRGCDVIARFGGDVFGVLVPETGDQAERVAANLLEALHDPVEVDGVAITVRASAGIVSAPGDGADPGTLLRRAESAMYAAKRHRTKVHSYSGGDDRGAARRLRLAGRLPGAIGSPEIEVHYQPVMDSVSSRCEHLEALVRWQHPELGLVPPMEFVPLAEQYGLGPQLFQRVLSDALAQCGLWRARHLARTVAVNVSPRSLLDAGFVAFVAAELDRAALPAGALVLELTEDAFACDGPAVRDALGELHGMGVKVAIDDFGTGYSSLAYLKQLPVSTVKLDRSFIAGLGSDRSDDAIVSLAVGFCHQLGLAVVGEGVETAAHLGALRRHGCDAAQGYWVCRPGPPGAISAWLAANRTGDRSFA